MLNVIEGDARHLPLPDRSVQCMITSPPYWGLRDYGIEEQIGTEVSPEKYVLNLIEVFDEVWRVLKDDGTAWLNLGDLFNRGSISASNNPSTKKKQVPGRDIQHLKSKDMCGMPWRVAFALQAPHRKCNLCDYITHDIRWLKCVSDSGEVKYICPNCMDTPTDMSIARPGFYLRADVIWDKPNYLPPHAYDRPLITHEYVFLLAKSVRYYYNTDATRVPYSFAAKRKAFAAIKKNTKHQTNAYFGDKAEIIHSVSKPKGYDGFIHEEEMEKRIAQKLTPLNPKGKQLRSVWRIPTAHSKSKHYATFPAGLIVPMILMSTKPGDIVLDPFSGTGTVGYEAVKYHRKFVGIELNSDYIRHEKRSVLKMLIV
jgi:DNA modification methylase